MTHAVSKRRDWSAAAGAIVAILSAGAAAQDADPELAIEEIIVTGIRGGLEAALDEKRMLTNLTEIINADDIGKMPDENVAEVLENIPGVQISRNSGIGNNVSVRGSDQNRVEINGRGTTPSGASRGGISFADLPAALVRSLNVVKVPTADMVEGSVGGTIDVKTYRGLNLREPLRVIRVDVENAENSGATNENFSATFGNNFSTDSGDVGAILTVTYSDKTVREDSLRVSPGLRNITAGNQNLRSQIDFDGDEVNDPYYRPGFGDLLFGLDDRKSFATSGSLEWQARDSLRLFVEANYLDNTQQQRGQSVFLGTPRSDLELDGAADATFDLVTVAGVQVPIMTAGIIGGGIRNNRTDPPGATATPNDGLQLRTNNRSGARETESYVAAIGGEWNRNDITVEFEASAAASDTVQPNFSLVFQFNDPTAANFHSAGARYRIPFQYDVRGDFLEYGPVDGAVTTAQLLDPNHYSLFLSRDQESFFDNRENAQKIDVTWDLGGKFVTSLLFGVRASGRSINRLRESQVTQNYPGFSGAELSQFLTATPGNFFEFNDNATYLDNFLTGDPIVIASQRQALRQTLGLHEGGVTDPLQGFGVDEKTNAAYVRADFDWSLFGVPLSGNAGVRAVNTDQTAFGSELLPDGTLQDLSESQRYTEWLPSASLVLAPWEDVQIRLGIARIMRRPSFGDLSPTVRFPLNVGQAVIVGNPRLEPTTADQYDLALEYYFRRGSVFSLGLYRKNLDGVIGRETIFGGICNPRAVDPNAGDPDLARPICEFGSDPGVIVNRISPVNLPGGTIQGVEFAFQHNFRNLPSPFDGLGIVANYAFQDGDRDATFRTPAFLRSSENDEEFPLNFVRLSENSYNVTLIYEKYRFSGRMRYTFRDNYLVSESIDVSNGQPLYQDDRGQLNASMSYDITDIFAITMSGVNLTKEQRIQPAVFPAGPIARVFDADRRISLGIRGRF